MKKYAYFFTVIYILVKKNGNFKLDVQVQILDACTR